jgi:hypothetical protein
MASRRRGVAKPKPKPSPRRRAHHAPLLAARVLVPPRIWPEEACPEEGGWPGARAPQIARAAESAGRCPDPARPPPRRPLTSHAAP